MAVHFNIFQSPLSGTHIIEASAGTGKTYAIEGLYLRLLMEKMYSVRDILVVTFTNAATAELRERIRGRLVELRRHLRGMHSEDRLVQKAAEAAGDKDEAAFRISGAIQGFDEAAVYTIHGFCARVLRENAFESNTLFDTELVSDQDDLVREAAEDFWRLNISKASGVFLEYALSKLSLHDLVSLYNVCSKLPLRRIIPESFHSCEPDLEVAYQEAFKRALEVWTREKERVKEILMENKALNRRTYAIQKIPQWIDDMDRFFFKDNRWDCLPDKAERFGSAAVTAAAKKGSQAPAHPFFDAWSDYLAQRALMEKDLNGRIISLKRSFLEYMKEELERRKTTRNMAHFDDLLTRLHRAVHSSSGGRLAQRIASRFKAALIDEFQDTDPVQYEIFRGLFWGEKGALFLIGDPKQAIYGFRGADIFTYMGAGREVPSRCTLHENWRSHPGLVDAVNAVFGSGGVPFIFPEITFEPVSAAKDRPFKELLLEEGPREPFIFWHIQRSSAEQEERARKEDIKRRICSGVCAEIARLVSLGRCRKAMLGQRPLEEADIAVLVKKNKEAEMIKEGLSRLNVPAVLHHMGSVFETPEAEELQRVLAAVEHPSRQEILRAALATDFMGLTAEQLEAGTSEFWDRWVSAFRAYGENWSSSGFMPMFRRLLSEQSVLARLAALEEGERRVTNLLHLAELLNRACLEKGKGMDELINWLTEKRSSDTQETDEYQLRLESDERAVQIVTVHRSKGLQYPVVFCPFMWDRRLRKNRSSSPLFFHDEKGTLVLDLGSESRELNLARAETEALAEEVRLLYVALTRACNRCYLVWNDLDAGPLLGHLLGGGSKMADGDLSALLAPVLRRAGGSIRFEPMPERSVPPLDRFGKKDSIDYKRFARKVDQGHLLMSFTAIKGDSEEVDAHDLDLQEHTSGPGALEGFPSGASAGVFIHRLFEEADFAKEALESRRHLIGRRLGEYGLEASWQEPLLSMMERVLSSPLPASEGAFSLHEIEAHDRINEMEFFFPVKAFSSASLLKALEAFKQHETGTLGGPQGPLSQEFAARVAQLEFTPVKGFMRGFIDLVFRFGQRYYLIDWKSNNLGDEPSAYCQAALESAMSRNLYHLQYLIYVTALHRFLALKIRNYDYERHFGEVFYLFIRGMDGKGSGIYTARPPLALVERLCTLMSS